ncbi:MAG: hypothetical protein KJ649_07595, partial [Proteobacteria bacterium]|nr:hypothetical protein [Pseudomonadota bacterium]
MVSRLPVPSRVQIPADKPPSALQPFYPGGPPGKGVIKLVNDVGDRFQICPHQTIRRLPRIPKGCSTGRFFRNEKKTALVINTSRGGVIDESDLIRALREGVIAGAGLDVFEHEPIQPGNELLSMKNVILTPHTAALTEEC